jgi:hypothetical protein
MDGTSASPTLAHRRVAAVHAAVNTTALALYTASLIARRRDRHGAGVALGLAGGVTATAGGFLGGHLSLARDAGLRASRAALDGEIVSEPPPPSAPPDPSSRRSPS